MGVAPFLFAMLGLIGGGRGGHAGAAAENCLRLKGISACPAAGSRL